MEQYIVTGMSCAACSARVEKAVSQVPGVTSCSVSLLTNSMSVEGSALSEEIITAVQNAGYGADLKNAKQNQHDRTNSIEDTLKDKETPILKRRLIASLGFLIILMYVSMGHMMWGWPLPSFFNNNHIAMGLLQLLLTIVIMVINQKFFTSGFKSLWRRTPNMDTLVALGSTAAFIYSTFALFAMTDAQVKGNADAVMSYMHEFYFESAAMILALITVGKMLEAKSKGRTTDALKSLMKLAPKTAVLVRDGKEVTVVIHAQADIDTQIKCFEISLLGLAEMDIDVLVFSFHLSKKREVESRTGINTQLHIIYNKGISQVHRNLDRIVTAFIERILCPFHLRIRVERTTLVHKRQFGTQRQALI